ncbi:MAG: hypothetical protein AAFP70_00485 [Calditrichota bacterium]
MDAMYPPKQSPYEERLRILMGFLNAYKVLTKKQREELDVDVLIVRLVKNDELLWEQIERNRESIFSEN